MGITHTSPLQAALPPDGDAYTWDWRNSTARDYFVDKVIRPWSLEDAVDAVFIDEGDVDMAKSIKAYKDAGFTGVMTPDHTPSVSAP